MRRAAALLVVILLTVAGCSGVPGSSGPQVVRTVGLGEAPAPSVVPPPEGASPREIVQGFLDAMTSNPDRLEVAKAYLDKDAAAKWTGSSVVVTQQAPLAGPETAQNTVEVTYGTVGSLSENGIYSPVLNGSGTASGGKTTYNLAKNSDGQWRIHEPLPQSLFIQVDDFLRRFTAKSVYFLDNAGTRLVPDLRYSALGEPARETVLLQQLVDGPRPELVNAVSAFAPAPNGSQRLTFTSGTPNVVQVPGAGGLDQGALRRLAAQLAFTLRESITFASDLQIRDGGRTLNVAGIGDTFDSSDFPDLAPVDPTFTPTVTYVRDGGVVGPDGKPLSGPVGTSKYGLDSAAFDSESGRTLVAGVTGADDSGRRRLLVGDTTAMSDTGLAAASLTPAVWAPVGTTDDTDDAWAAAGSTLYRVVQTSQASSSSRPWTASAVSVTGPNTPITGTITALSFSPEGSRLAMVISNGGVSQVWTASVSRNGPDAQVQQLEPITPTAYAVTDVGWRSDTSLAAVGAAAGFPIGIYLEVNVDGSRLQVHSPEGLSNQPRTLAVSPRSGAQWVTTGTGSDSAVWTRASSTGTWVPPAGGTSQAGRSPSFSI